MNSYSEDVLEKDSDALYFHRKFSSHSVNLNSIKFQWTAAA